MTLNAGWVGQYRTWGMIVDDVTAQRIHLDGSGFVR